MKSTGYLRANLEKYAQKQITTRDGRYIPYFGGFLGWYYNNGVLAHEHANHYRFHWAVDEEAFVRLNKVWVLDNPKRNRRLVPRLAARGKPQLELAWAGKTFTSVILSHISLQGADCIVRSEDSLTLGKGKTHFTAKFYEYGGEAPVFDLKGTVGRSLQTGSTKVWRVGLTFDEQIPFSVRQGFIDYLT